MMVGKGCGEMSLLEKGFTAFKKKDFQSAALIWTDALAKSSDDHGRGQLCLNLGIAYSQLGATKEAMLHYHQAVSYSEKTENLCVMGRAYMGLGQVYRRHNQLNDSIECFERALEIFEKLDDPISKEKARASCGVTYVEVGRTQDAKKALEEAYQGLLALDRVEEAEMVLTELQKQKRQ
jgi:tetratricopeptide (TPR) repeat protein